jgi:hypothetical protein
MGGWAPLATSTIRDKEAKGSAIPRHCFAPARCATPSKKNLTHFGLEVAVGSKEIKALWQEMGTSRGIPPRSFLGQAMNNSLLFAAETFGKIAVSIQTGKP